MGGVGLALPYLPSLRSWSLSEVSQRIWILPRIMYNFQKLKLISLGLHIQGVNFDQTSPACSSDQSNEKSLHRIMP